MCTRSVKVWPRSGRRWRQRRASVPCHPVHLHPLALYHPNSFARVGKPVLQTRISLANFCAPLASTGGCSVPSWDLALPLLYL